MSCYIKEEGIERVEKTSNIEGFTATIKSFVFSVLNNFFGNTYKKEDGIEKASYATNPRGYLYSMCNEAPALACSFSPQKFQKELTKRLVTMVDGGVHFC